MRSDEELIRLSHDGSARATESLLARYRPLVENKARAYFLLGADHDDVVQEGMIGLFKAVRDYREHRQSCFRAFADLCVTRHILSAVKTASRLKHFPLNFYHSLYQSSSPDRDADGAILDTLPDPRSCDPVDHVIGRVGAAGRVDAARDLLSGLEERVLDGYLEGKSYREMSHEFSCLPKTIDNALQRVRRKIEISVAAEPG